MLTNLKQQVYQANLELRRTGLVILTWGNASGIDRQRGLVVIKPSGVSYEMLTPDQLVVLDMDGNRVEGDLNPSSDTPTHLELYKAFDSIGGIVHTHSTYATMFAQACREIPCFGTTHADHFYGAVPITRALNQNEVDNDYEANTGCVIVERMQGVDVLSMPAVLVAQHGPFTWGKDAHDAAKNALILEEVARMAKGTIEINPDSDKLPQYLMDKHYLRKHGSNAYYGQK